MLADYQEFRLCREMGWTPAQLAEQDAEDVVRYAAFVAAEAEAKEWWRSHPERG